jgi:hypothetical protein
MESITLERDSKHFEVDATYSIVISKNSEKFLQIDTYGSSDRQEQAKKSQSIRFSPEAIKQLKEILAKL